MTREEFIAQMMINNSTIERGLDISDAISAADTLEEYGVAPWIQPTSPKEEQECDSDGANTVIVEDLERKVCVERGFMDSDGTIATKLAQKNCTHLWKQLTVHGRIYCMYCGLDQSKL